MVIKSNISEGIGYKFHIKHDNGDTLEFKAKSVNPLGFSSLMKAKEGKPLSINIHAEEILLNGHLEQEDGVISLEGFNPKKNQIVALSFDGWIPLMGIPPKSEILIDQNFIYNIEGINENLEHESLYNSEWWISTMKHKEIIINPALYALERCSFNSDERNPSFDDFLNQFERAIVAIKKYSSQLSVPQYKKRDYLNIYSLIEHHLSTLEREIDFLVNIILYIKKFINESSKRERNREDVKCKIINEASKRGIDKKSLCVLMVLSCLYEKNKYHNTGREVLNPKGFKENNEKKQAYNACMDLFNLQMLLHIQAANPNKSMYFLTGDYGLAAFWVALTPIENKEGCSEPRFTLSMTEHLFPECSEEERIEILK